MLNDTFTLTLTNPKTTPKLLLNYNCSTTRLNDSTLRLHSLTDYRKLTARQSPDNSRGTLLCAAYILGLWQQRPIETVEWLSKINITCRMGGTTTLHLPPLQILKALVLIPQESSKFIL